MPVSLKCRKESTSLPNSWKQHETMQQGLTFRLLSSQLSQSLTGKLSKEPKLFLRYLQKEKSLGMQRS